MHKKQLGQFYTTNAQYIVKDLLEHIPPGVIVVDPFAGNKDLLNVITDNPVEGYDIEPKNKEIIQRDTLENPLDYTGRFILTNPPYLAKNKTKDKKYFEQYKTDDLYKCAIKSISGCIGGIIIIPINFFCGYDSDIRSYFFAEFQVDRLVIFEESVFDDTDYAVCAFAFSRRSAIQVPTRTTFRPSGDNMWIEVNAGDRLGSSFDKYISLESYEADIYRLIEGSDIPDSHYITRLYIRGCDTGSSDGRISLCLKDEPFVGKITDRVFATLVCSKDISLIEENVVYEFNRILEIYREKERSLFLTNYRNSTKLYSRKRISFEQVFKLTKFIITKILGHNANA